MDLICLESVGANLRSFLDQAFAFGVWATRGDTCLRMVTMALVEARSITDFVLGKSGLGENI